MQPEPHYRSILKEQLAERCRRNPKYSMRGFARALGVSPGVLSQILSGKNVPSGRRARQLLAGLDLAPDDQRLFLRSIVEAHSSRDLKRRSRSIPALEVEAAPARDLSLDLFRVISDWYHYALIMLTHVEGFQESPKWIARQLGISEAEALLAMDRLKKLGILQKKRGRWIASEGFTTADKHLTTAALRSHQRQVLQKAIDALEQTPIERRSMTSYTMAIDPARLPEAKKIIERATLELGALLESGRRTEVYQLGIALYPLQQLHQKEK